jgi:hypothetical protein
MAATTKALLTLRRRKIVRTRFCQLGSGLDAPSAVANPGSFGSSGICRCSRDETICTTAIGLTQPRGMRVKHNPTMFHGLRRSKRAVKVRAAAIGVVRRSYARLAAPRKACAGSSPKSCGTVAVGVLAAFEFAKLMPARRSQKESRCRTPQTI